MSDMLESERELFPLAVDLCPSGMLAIDAESRIVLVNREIERMFGYAREELLGRSIETLVPIRAREVHPHDRARYMRAPTARPMGSGRDLHGLRKDGTEVPVEIGLNPVETKDGLVILASVVDISQRVRAEEQLRHAQKMEAIGALAGGIAHDFNNILAGIIGYAELAQRAASAQQRADLDQVLTAAQRGRQLVKRILTFGCQREGASTNVRLEQPLREALALLRATLPSTVEIVEQIDPTTPAVLVDETEVHQIIMNLATNAAHAMPTGGRISVELAPLLVDDTFAQAHPGVASGLFAKLTVRDTGVGMDESVRARALEPFFSTKAPDAGSGLGLSVLHGIVTSRGGLLQIDSAVGQGTSVKILLPASVAIASPTVGARQGPKVLLVDDEVALTEMMRRLLRDEGYDVTAYSSSLDALEYFKNHAAGVDVVISDNTMPHMTGLQMVREVHKLRPDLPVILASGLAEQTSPEVLQQSGVSRLLAKPFNRSELLSALDEVLGERAAHSAC